MSPVQRQTARARRLRVRVKLGVTVLIAYGYAMLAAALWTPFANGSALTPVNLTVVLLGLAVHVLALYLAPEGEPE
jgi:hypothetical protein